MFSSLVLLLRPHSSFFLFLKPTSYLQLHRAVEITPQFSCFCPCRSKQSIICCSNSSCSDKPLKKCFYCVSGVSDGRNAHIRSCLKISTKKLNGQKRFTPSICSICPQPALPALPALLLGNNSIPKPNERYNLYSTSWICPGVSSQSDMSENPHHRDVRRHSSQLPNTSL